MREKDLQEMVIELAQYSGWMHYHTYNSRRSNPGWPDLVLCRQPELIIVELKSAKGQVTKDQKKWLIGLRACGVEVYVWRPQHWLNGTIEERLNRK